MTPHLEDWASWVAWMDSEMVPTVGRGEREKGGKSQLRFEKREEGRQRGDEDELWLILSKRPLQAFFSMAVLIRTTLVTVKSSPTT